MKYRKVIAAENTFVLLINLYQMKILRLLKHLFNFFGFNITKKNDFEKTVLTHVLKNNLSPVIFDVGAFVGEKTLYYRSVFPESRIYCFEPFTRSFIQLNKNISGLQNIVLENYAISNHIGKAQFSVKTGFDQGNSLLDSATEEFGIIASNILKEDSKVEVQITTLDNYTENHQISKIDLLKLDIQGAELMALKGAEQLIQQQRIDFIYLEGQFLKMYQGQVYFHNICEYLYEKEYRLYNFFGGQSIGFQLREVNALFYRKNLQLHNK